MFSRESSPGIFIGVNRIKLRNGLIFCMNSPSNLSLCNQIEWKRKYDWFLTFKLVPLREALSNAQNERETMTEQLGRLLSANKELQDGMEMLQTELGRKQAAYDKLLEGRYTKSSFSFFSCLFFFVLPFFCISGTKVSPVRSRELFASSGRLLECWLALGCD